MYADWHSGTMLRRAAVALAAAAVAVPAAEVRVARAARPLTDDWQHLPVAARDGTQLGISFRPRQAEIMGLNADDSLTELLAYPFDLIRLGAYWNQIEPAPGRFCPDEIDRHVDAAERAGKQIIVCVGPVKTFGYPEFFVPEHHLRRPLPEGVLIEPAAHQELLDAATAFLTRIIERYRDRRAIVVGRWSTRRSTRSEWSTPGACRPPSPAPRSTRPARPTRAGPSEGQAEPWEAVTNPPSPVNEGMASCLPEHLIENYNQCMRWNEGGPSRLSGYLFWGAEYWLLRQRNGDPRYLRAFARVLEES